MGLGNYDKFLIDANLSTPLNSKTDVGVDIHYLSTSGLKDEYPWSTKQRDFGISGFAKYYGNSGKSSVDLDFNRKNYNYYGVRNEIFQYLPISHYDALKHGYNKFGINAHYDFYSNEILNDIGFRTYLLSDDLKGKETTTHLWATLSKHGLVFKNGIAMNADLKLDIQTQNSKFSILNQSQNHYFAFTATPELKYEKDKYFLMLSSAFSPVLYRNTRINFDERKNKFYWFPKAEAVYKMNQKFNFYAGLSGGVESNSYHQTLEENPYLSSDQMIRPTIKRYEIYFGTKGDWSNTIKYNISAGFSKLENVMFFKGNDLMSLNNQKSYSYANTFSMEYENGKRHFFNFNLQYFPMLNLILEGDLLYQGYNLSNNAVPFNIPSTKMELGAKYSLLDKKLHLSSKAYWIGQRTTNAFFVVGTSPQLETLDNHNIKLNSFFDINFSAEYHLYKNFSIFAHANNVLGTKYQNYYGYKVLGFQILGGLKFSY